jgi:hypothetical protein
LAAGFFAGAGFLAGEAALAAGFFAGAGFLAGEAALAAGFFAGASFLAGGAALATDFFPGGAAFRVGDFGAGAFLEAALPLDETALAAGLADFLVDLLTCFNSC